MTKKHHPKPVPEKEIQETPEPKIDSQKELGELRASLQRVQADFDNYRKNTEREKSEIRKKALVLVLLDLVPVLDNFERSTRHIPKELCESDWTKGVQLIHQQLQEILGREGLEKINTAGVEFDPYLHEAISHESSKNHKSNEIIEEVESGYKFGDEVLKHAKVRVAK